MVNQIIKEYALAFQAAEANAKEMTKFNPNTKLCVKRMDRVAEAESALFNLPLTENLPKPLVDFFIAELDKGCDSCWLSSRKDTKHEICMAKISRWFKTHDLLVEYGLTL